MPELQSFRPAAQPLPLPVFSTGGLIEFPNSSLPAQVSTEDLVAHAEVLAREFGYDRLSAIAAELEWYQQRVGKEICTLTRANHLRSLVLLRCREESLPPNARSFRRRQQSAAVQRWDAELNAIGAFLILIAILLLGSLIHDAPQQGDADYPAMELPSIHSPAALGAPLPDADRAGR